MATEEIASKVKSGEIRTSCWDCAEKHRIQPKYDGTYTQYLGACQICKETKPVTSAAKLFGYHHFL